MRLSIREALFGGEEVDEWTDPLETEAKAVSGYENYTPEILEKLENLFAAGKIPSRPVFKGLAFFSRKYKWEKEDGTVHRENNLPAAESETETEYVVNGTYHREDGPAAIGTDRIAWYLNGRKKAHFFADVQMDMPSEQLRKYIIDIKTEFPGVGKKIFPWDWCKKMSITDQKITDFYKKHAMTMKLVSTANYRKVIALMGSEALFSGEEVDEWTPPVDEWILAIENKEWTPEFMAAVKKKSSKTSYHSAHSVRYRKVGYDYTKGKPCDDIAWTIGYNSQFGPTYDVNFIHYYSKKTDVMVSIERGLISRKDEFLDHASQLREINYTGDQHGLIP